MSRPIRVAATADVHVGEGSQNLLKPAFQRVSEEADVLIISGDLTGHGTLPEIDVLIDELSVVKIPIVAVLGNHDFHSGLEEELAARLRGAGVHVLDGDTVELELAGEKVGFTGAKGFVGGYGVRRLSEFGEDTLKKLFRETSEEVSKIREGLSRLGGRKIVVLHYVPIIDTLLGEPHEIWAFMGSSLLAEPVDELGAEVIFHGHAHFGREEGQTKGGIPVRNVARPLLDGVYALFQLHPGGPVTRLRPRYAEDRMRSEFSELAAAAPSRARGARSL